MTSEFSGADVTTVARDACQLGVLAQREARHDARTGAHQDRGSAMAVTTTV